MAKKKDDSIVKVNVDNPQKFCNKFLEDYLKLTSIEKVLAKEGIKSILILDDEILCEGIVSIGMDRKLGKMMGGIEIGNRTTKNKKGKDRTRKAKK